MIYSVLDEQPQSIDESYSNFVFIFIQFFSFKTISGYLGYLLLSLIQSMKLGTEVKQSGNPKSQPMEAPKETIPTKLAFFPSPVNMGPPLSPWNYYDIKSEKGNARIWKHKFHFWKHWWCSFTYIASSDTIGDLSANLGRPIHIVAINRGSLRISNDRHRSLLEGGRHVSGIIPSPPSNANFRSNGRLAGSQSNSGNLI